MGCRNEKIKKNNNEPRCVIELWRYYVKNLGSITSRPEMHGSVVVCALRIGEFG